MADAGDWDRGDTAPEGRHISHLVEVTAPIVRLDEHLLGLLARAGAPATLGALGITREALDEVLATRPELPGDIARAAL
jgi:hypothetical protein